MKKSGKQLKTASICFYVLVGLALLLAAVAYAFENPICWALVLAAFVLLYVGLVLKQRAESAENGPDAKEQPKKAGQKKTAGKSKAVVVMCVALIVVLLASFSASYFETSGFHVDVSDFTLTHDMTYYYNNGEINGEQYVLEREGASYAVTMYVPDTATESAPAPTVFVLPGFTRTKATMSQYCIELSRRGFVVFTLDPGGQGGTTETSTAGANGIEYLVQYVYNNTDDFKFCDRNRFGAIGHSAGGGNVCTLAADMSGDTYQESVIKAVYISGYIKASSANKYTNLVCNAALAYAYYDEGSFRYQTDTSAFEVISRRFINEVKGQQNDYNTVAYDYGYGDLSSGTYRIVHREAINHCFEMYDPISIANTIDFFDEALAANSGIPGTKQVWFGKELSNGVALAAAFTFILSLCAVLMKTPFFATMKENASAPALCSEKRQSVAHKMIFWSSMLVTAIIACLDYIPLANLSIEVFPVGNSSSVFTYVFPARMVNAILLWAAINGTIGLVIFFGTTIVEWLWEKARAKAKGQELTDFDWGKFKAILVPGKSAGQVVGNVLKTLLLAFGLFGVFYLLVAICLCRSTTGCSIRTSALCSYRHPRSIPECL